MICGNHFRDEDYKSSKRSHLKVDAVPHIFAWSRKLPHDRTVKIDEKPPSEKRTSSPSVDALKDKIITQQKKIKSLQQQVRREKKKNKTLSDVIDELKGKKFISGDTCEVLKTSFSGLSYDILANHFKNKDKSALGHRYSDEVKRFALTIHFYSPRAYEYLRPIFSLPHPRSLCEWTSSVKCEPGFFKDVFEHIKSLTALDPRNADCALLCDGISIRNNVVYNKRTGQYVGFIDLGKNIVVEDEDAEATEGLVFMLTSLRSSWKFPIGYVLINKINGSTLHALLAEALRLGLEHGLRIRAITMDGLSANLTAMRMFGCKLSTSLENIDGQFSFDGYEYPLFFCPDPPHMLKLARNALGELKILQDADGNKIEWRFIESLIDLQQSEGLKLGGNKLSKKHLMYEKCKMKVNIAAQTLSSSVADAIQFLDENDVPEFQGSGPTVSFIRKIDRIFDLLNSRNPRGKGFKAPMRRDNIGLTDHIINSTVSYLAGLTDENGQSMLRHRRKTFVLGLITASKTVQALSKQLFQMKDFPFKYLLTYKLSQDHLELLFNCVRGKLGRNTNPDVQELKHALRRILLHAALVPSKHGNCLSFEEDRPSPLFSLKWSKNRTPINHKAKSENVIDNEYIDIEIITQNSEIKEYTLGYIAGFIVRQMLKSLTCDRCVDALLSKSKELQYLSLVALKDNGGLIYASEDVIKIISIAERVFRQFVSGTSPEEPQVSGTKRLHLKLLTKTVYEATISDVFRDLFLHDMERATNLDEDLHSTQLIKEVASRFLTLRLLRYGQTYSMQRKDVGKRNQANKLLHFQGY